MITNISQLDSNTRYSYADYLSWKFEQVVELIKGVVLPMAAQSRSHQRISWRLTVMLDKALTKKKCQAFAAPFDVRLLDAQKSAVANKDIFTVVQPDLCVVCDEKKLDAAGCLGSPDLMIEILAPSNSEKEMRIKKELYEENGVLEYWIFDPIHESVTAFILDKNKGQYQAPQFYFSGDKLNSSVFDKLSLNLSKIFENNG